MYLLGVICGLSLFLVLVLLREGFLWVLRFPPLPKKQHFKFQFDPESESHRFVKHSVITGKQSRFILFICLFICWLITLTKSAQIHRKGPHLYFALLNSSVVFVQQYHTFESMSVFSGHATNTNTSTSMKLAIFGTLIFPITKRYD